jgi:alpha-D-ribose 1-methylphosphonate 5-triphosphate synthase subunit PhnL
MIMMQTNNQKLIEVRGLGKMFTLHNQGGIRLPVLRAIDFDASRGECLVLSGRSGTGKSTLLRCLYGNYLATEGTIRLRDTSEASEPWVELTNAPEQRVLKLRRDVIGYVSQFLRAIRASPRSTWWPIHCSNAAPATRKPAPAPRRCSNG